MGNYNQQIEAIAIKAIEDILTRKRGKIEPCVAHINEVHEDVYRQVKESLRKLCRDGKLIYQLDVNKMPMFKFNDNA